ncbi:MAG TPA: hypothetical protein VGO91_01950 [Pyrinomonadaceae bacterium]|jgi:hypothetical protein|nr:hypothetical protein [Pyrinomonadaceae bacterium]
MSRRVNPSTGRRSRRLNTFLWVGALTVITIALIYFEQTAILYILATLGVTALLGVVAVADLRGTDSVATDPLPVDDAAAIGSGLQGTLTGAANSSRTARQKASRK